MELTNDEREIILEAARQSILSAFGEAEKPEINYTAYPLLKQKMGAFVTLKIDKELRGCIGYIIAIDPLFDTVCESARAAAFNDPRFKELTREEFDKIKIEISVLSAFEPIKRLLNTSRSDASNGAFAGRKNSKPVLPPRLMVLKPQFMKKFCEIEIY